MSMKENSNKAKSISAMNGSRKFFESNDFFILEARLLIMLVESNFSEVYATVETNEKS